MNDEPWADQSGAAQELEKAETKLAQELGRRAMCPRCGSLELRRDSASPWVFLGAICLFPIGLLLFALNENRYCLNCRIRFKLPSRSTVPSKPAEG